MEINKIYNENCLETMARMPDGFVDLTVTSPPYDELRTYNGYSFPFEDIARELFRITKDGGVVVWIVGDATVKGSETGTSFRQALHFKGIGFNLHDTMIYYKDSFQKPSPNRYWSCMEYMFVFSKGKPKAYNLICDRKNKQAGKKTSGKTARNANGTTSKRKDVVINDYGRRTNVWTYKVGYMKSTADKIAYQHSAIFPEQLANDHIISWSNENDLVYDPFMGSGTTAKMAILNKRNWIGSEISKEYCEIAEKRINENLTDRRTPMAHYDPQDTRKYYDAKVDELAELQASFDNEVQAHIATINKAAMQAQKLGTQIADKDKTIAEQAKQIAALVEVVDRWHYHNERGEPPPILESAAALNAAKEKTDG